jgi:hypothetical protein
VNRISLVAALAAVLGLAVAGCGSSSDDNDKKKPASGEKSAPVAKQTLAAELPSFNKAIAAQTCAAYAPFALTYTRPPGVQPGAGPDPKECVNYKVLLSQNLKGVRFTKAKDFGAAALAEGPGPTRGGYSNHTGVFVLDTDGKYRFFLTNTADPQIGSSPKAGTDFQKTADAFVKAVRDKDCAAFRRTTNPAGGFYRGVKSQQEACNAVFGGRYLAPQLKADTSAKPVKLGETLDFGFYGVATKKNYFTMVMSTRPDDATAAFKGRDNTLVFDYFPNYPVA